MTGASRERLFVWLVVLLAVGLNAAMLWPEISITRVDVNDNVFHFTLVERVVQAVERGENPLDCWSPEWTLGYPVLRTYQPLAHWMVAAVYFALAKTVPLMTVFVWFRFLAVCLLPVSFFVAARRMGLTPTVAAAAALLCPLVKTNFLYGVEQDSFTWSGSGLFPQCVAAHFLVLALGFGVEAVRTGKRVALAGILLGATFLSHLIYGYMGALSLCLLWLLPDEETPRRERIRRVVWIGAVSVIVVSFQLLPLVKDAAYINHSRWEPGWKWDSFGAMTVLKELAKGELLDYGRLPVLSLLALAGVGAFLWNLRAQRKSHPAHAYLLLGAGFWLLMFFGRPFWGPVPALLGASPDMHLHRVIGGVHIFFVLVAAAGLAALWDEVAPRWGFGAAALMVAVILNPAVRERVERQSNNATWGRASLTAYATEQKDLNTAIDFMRSRGGRAYPGLAAGWGGQFRIGEVPFHAFLSEAQIPTVAFLYHSMALTSDIMVRFDESRPVHYRLFNIRSVAAPVAQAMNANFLTPAAQFGAIRVLDAPGGGYFDLVDVPAAVRTTRMNFYDVNDRWMASDWAQKRVHLWLDFRGEAPPDLPRLAPEEALNPTFEGPDRGLVRGEQQNGDEYQAEITAARPEFALFKMTWHANWKAWIDGAPAATAMLSPGFIGVPVTPGAHRLVLRYVAEWWKLPLAFAGCVLCGLLLVVERRGGLARIEAAVLRALAAAWRVFPVRFSRRASLTALGLVILSLPVCYSLLTGNLLDGHDATEYVPRLVEFHQNIAHGILLPRWAPDLNRGHGQPFFLFNPPLIYYAGELWHLLGFDFVTSLNLVFVTIVLGSAASMFLLGRLYFGEMGGWLAAAAYLYAPYFAVNVYVRSALAESAAFPFMPLALYGFGAYAREGRLKHLMVGALGYAGVLLSHNPAALFFTPLVGAFVVFTAWMARSRRVFVHQVYGILLGLGLAAFVWLPAIAERGEVGVERLLQGPLRYSNHFVYFHQLFDSPWGYGISLAGDRDGMSFSMGWSHLLLVACALGWLLWRRKAGGRAYAWFFVAAAAAFALLMLTQAQWLWDALPLLQYTEFPWRMLAPAAVCVAMTAGLAGSLLAAAPRWRSMGFAAAMVLLVVPNLPHFFPPRERVLDESFWSARQIAERGIEVTTAAEYSPKWVEAAAPFDNGVVKVISGGAKVVERGRTLLSWSGDVTGAGGSLMEMPMDWFPGWEVRVDGDSVASHPAPVTGLLRFEAPAGAHRVEVAWTRTPLRLASEMVSLLSLVAVGVVAFARRTKSPILTRGKSVGKI